LSKQNYSINLSEILTSAIRKMALNDTDFESVTPSVVKHWYLSYSPHTYE